MDWTIARLKTLLVSFEVEPIKFYHVRREPLDVSRSRDPYRLAHRSHTLHHNIGPHFTKRLHHVSSRTKSNIVVKHF
jgi:DNA repair photolyase